MRLLVARARRSTGSKPLSTSTPSRPHGLSLILAGVSAALWAGRGCGRWRTPRRSPGPGSPRWCGPWPVTRRSRACVPLLACVFCPAACGVPVPRQGSAPAHSGQALVPYSPDRRPAHAQSSRNPSATRSRTTPVAPRSPSRRGSGRARRGSGPPSARRHRRRPGPPRRCRPAGRVAGRRCWRSTIWPGVLGTRRAAASPAGRRRAPPAGWPSEPGVGQPAQLRVRPKWAATSGPSGCSTS